MAFYDFDLTKCVSRKHELWDIEQIANRGRSLGDRGAIAPSSLRTEGEAIPSGSATARELLPHLRSS